MLILRVFSQTKCLYYMVIVSSRHKQTRETLKPQTNHSDLYLFIHDCFKSELCGLLKVTDIYTLIYIA